MSSKCENCKLETDQQKTIINGGKLFRGCDLCMPALLQQGTAGAAKYYRDRQKEDYRRDLVQPNQGREYIKAYGVSAARDRGWSDELIRKLS